MWTAFVRSSVLQLKVELIPLDLNNPDHVGCLFKVRTHPRVAEMMPGAPPCSFLDHVRYLYGVKDKVFALIQVERQLCGYCQRTERKEERELGWALHPDYWGRGIGKAAVAQWVEESRGKPLMLTVQKNNPVALGLYQSRGFCITEERENSYVMYYQS